ncbi:MAG: hypothetical protein GTO18_04230 [Anaerolineales bacterium]|nr:hypothetical protein [Anaerolineales bacterium]
MVLLKLKSSRLLVFFLMAITISNCTGPAVTPASNTSTSAPSSDQSGTPSAGPLRRNIDQLSARWDLAWDASRSVYVGRKAGVAQISLTEFEEG